MNTKQRLSNDLLNDGEIIIEKRFVKLYESEIDKIDEQISDLKKLDQKDFDAKGEVEEKARAYYRAFAREFYDVCEGRVSDDEFFDLWEREEELKTGINSGTAMCAVPTACSAVLWASRSMFFCLPENIWRV